jgi:short-subunit dehydrogenase
MTRRTIAGARTIVTGASSGIGRSLVVELARHGARLLVTARREARLAALVDELGTMGNDACYVAGDVTEAGLRERLVETARTRWGGLDLLINNAGVGAVGPFAQADEPRLRRVMEVNFFAPAELIRRAIPLLRGGQSPMIVNVGSVLGHRAIPFKSEYCASKFALHGLSDALRSELTTLGIDVLLVSPSTTETEFFEHVLEDQAAPPAPRLGVMPPDRVARHIVRAIRHGRHEIILSAGGKLAVWFDRLCPPLANRLVAWVAAEKRKPS